MRIDEFRRSDSAHRGVVIVIRDMEMSEPMDPLLFGCACPLCGLGMAESFAASWSSWACGFGMGRLASTPNVRRNDAFAPGLGGTTLGMLF
jgi:hypothetical protein